MKRKILKSICLSLVLASLLSVTGFCSDIDNTQISEDNILENKVGYNEATLLHYACQIGDTETVKYLIDRGADVNSLDACDDTPLHYACIYGNLDIVKILLDNGANVNSLDYFDTTPLYTAVSNADIVSLLIENGADIEIANFLGDTPLIHACSHGYTESMKVMLENGADANCVTEYGSYPIHYVTNEEQIDLLLQYGADINSKDLYTGSTPLEYAIYDIDLVKIILDKGADVNSTNSYGNTALIFALDSYILNEDIIKLLLDNGADVNIKNNCGKYALNYALDTGNENIIKLISEKSSMDVINSILINNI